MSATRSLRLRRRGAAASALRTFTAVSLSVLLGLVGAAIGTGAGAPPAGAVTFGQGYWLVARDGGVFTFGAAAFHGSTGNIKLNAPVVGAAAYPFLEGYWLVASDGGIFSFGSADFHGSMGSRHLNAPVVGIASTPSGNGYWLVGSDGGVFSFGDAHFLGSMGGQHLNAPVVGIASTPSGNGYWLVASDGGVFSFGDAGFHNSMGGRALNKPVVGMASTPSGKGYWLVASDGGIFSFGDAGFFGSTGALRLNAPVVGMSPSNSGAGYRLVGRDGGVFSYGDAQFLGSTGSRRLNQPVQGVMTRPTFGIKVDPFPATAAGDASSWASGSLSLHDGATPETGGDIPAGARVLGVEGLTVSQLGTLSFAKVSGTCDDIRPRFDVYLDSNHDGTGDTIETLACGTGTSDGATVSFDPTSQAAPSAIVTGMDLLQDAPGTTAVLDDIHVAGLTISDFTTQRQATG